MLSFTTIYNNCLELIEMRRVQSHALYMHSLLGISVQLLLQ